MNYKFLVLFTFFLFVSVLQSQTVTRMDDIRVFNKGKLIPNPFAGGLKAGQFSKVDLDGDGVKDLFVFDRNSGVITTYINEGGVGEINYRYDPMYESIFPKALTFMILHDFNKDGIEDVFKDPSVGNISGIEVWRGVRDASGLRYELMINRPDYNNVLYFINGTSPVQVYNSIIDIPAIVDVDGDGDTDILSFEPDGGYLNYYRNRAVEKNLGLDTFDFVFTTADPDQKCFGKFLETMFSSEVILSSDMNSCAEGVVGHPSTNGGPRHAGSTVNAFDADCDGDIDLILGDFLTTNIVYLENGGSAIKSWITDQDDAFPSYDVPASMEVFLSSFYIDINNDGNRDLIVTPNQEDVGRNQEHVWLYLNEGSDCAPVFKLFKKDFLIDEMLHFSRQSHPKFVDYNADGLVDILVGCGGEIISGVNIKKQLFLLENVGTTTEPAFSVVDDDYLGFSQVAEDVSRISPDFADIDNDGDLDLFLGSSIGDMYFYNNTAGPNKTLKFDDPIIPYFDIFIGSNSAPEFYDVNKDGLLDLTIGERNNELNFLENIGTKENADFNLDLTASGNSKDLGNFHMEINNFKTRNGRPVYFESIDKTYLLMGFFDGTIKLFDNISSNPIDTFNVISNSLGNIYAGESVTCDIEDINGDGKYDLVVGNERGGLNFYSTSLVKNRSLNNANVDIDNVIVYPNPTGGDVLVSNLVSDFIVGVYSLSGQKLMQVTMNKGVNVLDMTNLESGVYSLHFVSESKSFTKKIVKQ